MKPIHPSPATSPGDSARRAPRGRGAGGEDGRAGRSRLAKRLAAAGLGVAAALAAVELGHRLWLRAEGRPYDRAALHRRLARGLEASLGLASARATPGSSDGAGEELGAFPVLHPFFGSEPSPDSGGVLRYFEAERGADDFAVVVLGGSVAAALAPDRAPDRAIDPATDRTLDPAVDPDGVLASLLQADPRLTSRDVRVLGFAHAGYKEPQQIGCLAWLLAFGHHPDAVVSLDGLDELALSQENAQAGTHPLYPAEPVWGAVLRDRVERGASGLELLLEMRALHADAVRLVQRSLRLRLTASSLLGRWLEARVDGLHARETELGDLYLARAATPPADHRVLRQRCGADFDPAEEAVVELAVTSWFEGSLSLWAMCAARGIPYVHVLQPTLLDAGSKPPTERERRFLPGPPGWQRAVELGYPLLRERGRRLAERGVPFLDASRTFAGAREELYADAIRLDARGNRRLAELVAEALLARLPDERAAAGSAAAERDE